MRLSGETAAKQRRVHPDLKPDDYALVQRILDEGELFRTDDRRMVGFVEADGRLWRASIKSTDDGSETYLATLHRARERDLRSAERRYKRIDREES